MKPSRDPLLWLVASVFGAMTVLIVARAPDALLWGRYVGWYGSLAWGVLGVVGPWIALPALGPGRERTFWRLWSLVFALSLSIDVLNVLPDQDTFGPLMEDALYGLMYLSALGAFWLSPHRMAPPAPAASLRWVELMGGAVFVVVLAIYFVLIPDLVAPTAYVRWVPSLLLFISLDLVLLGMAVHAFVGATPGRWRVVHGWLAASMAVWLSADSLEALHIGGLAPWLDAGSTWDVVWQAAWALPVIAMRMRGVPAVGEPEEPANLVEGALTRPSMVLVLALCLPFIHFASDFPGLLPPETHLFREATVLVGMTLLVALALVHQGMIRAVMASMDRSRRATEGQRALLAAAIEHSPDGVVIAGADRKVVYANRAFRSLQPSSQVGLDLVQALIPPGSNPGEWDARVHLVDEGIWKGRLSHHDDDGTPVESVVTISPVPDGTGTIQHYVGVRRDVSREAMLEAQLRHSQTMEALGTLAGGIAHDFNNILAAIGGYAEFLDMDLPEDSPWKDDVHGILTGTERAAQLVRKILMFSRKGWEDRRSHSAAELVKEALSLLRASLPATIELRTELDPSAGAIWADAHQVHQVVLNLGANAAHAMEREGGTLHVSLAPVTVTGPEEENPGGVTPGEYVRLTMQDTGTGMSPATVRRAFEPFYTTKAVGKGTGLGLSMVHGIVTGHGGGVVLESEPAVGTSVHVYFPLAEPNTVPAPTPGTPAPRSRLQGSVLIVDDEPDVSRAMGKALEARGWSVKAVTRSSAALDLVREPLSHFDAVITDLTMPGRTGPELARELKDVRPRLPVVLMSGFGDSTGIGEGTPPYVDAFLRKPSSVDEVEDVLTRLIREATGDAD
jgi:PAS domain S-box-containing protein